MCECKTCGRIFSTEGKHIRFANLHSCGCIHSLGEQKIIKLLDENNITYSTQFHFDDLLGIGKRPLRFDFAIFDSNNKLDHLIEYDGLQHYAKSSGS